MNELCKIEMNVDVVLFVSFTFSKAGPLRLFNYYCPHRCSQFYSCQFHWVNWFDI